VTVVSTPSPSSPPGGAPDGVEAGATLLEVRDLEIFSRIGGQEREIVSGVDLDVRAGEAIAIVGESGSGKSMTAKAITGLLPDGVRASGSVRYCGREVLALSARERHRLRGREMSMIFQDPFTMLNPLLRVGAQLVDTVGMAEGRRLRGSAAREDAERRLEEVSIGDPTVVGRYPFQLSGGMRQRVGIAAALAQDPRLLIADEPTTALDVTTQRGILVLLKRLQQSRGMGLLLITHDLRIAFSMCDRVYVMYAGSLLEVAPAKALEGEPLHPYTLSLLLAEPPLDRRLAELMAIPGSVPTPSEVADECAFAPRCRWATDVCRSARPPLALRGDGRLSACVRLDELRDELRVLRHRALIEAPDAPQRRAMSLVEVKDLAKAYTSNRGKVRTEALRGVSITVGQGESVGIVGESGSGKTTLVRCLAGLEHASSGSIILAGEPLQDATSLTAVERRRVRETMQLVFQDPYSSLNPSRSVESALRDVLRLREPLSRRAASQRVGELLEQVGLPRSYAKRKPIALSGGERQRVAIARALAGSPKVLICDEPVSALDVSVQAQILNLLRRLREQTGISLLFITHDLAVVRQVADRIYVMHRGVVVEEGLVDDVVDRPAHEYTRQLVASIPSEDWELAGGGTSTP
jgi:peptide/nickel transport system ATP-binding protein